MLGRARKIVVAKDSTTVIDGDGTEADVKARIKQIEREIENTESDWDREKLNERLAKLSGGVVVIKVGAATEVELKEKKHRIEDAVSAARAAVEEGVVPGGGVALLRAQTAIDKLRGGSDDEKTGRLIVRRSMEEPLRQIAINAGFEGGVVVETVRKGEGAFGFNAATGVYEDLIAAGVPDPAKVTRSTLQNAASIAALLLTTEALVVEQKEDHPPMPAGGGDHGMDF
jgi:chaperonin GroEL